MRFCKKDLLADVLGSPRRLAMPILSAPGIAIIGADPDMVYQQGEMQFKCIAALAERYPADLLVTFMDLTVEAEAFGCSVQYSGAGIPSLSGKLLQESADCQKLAVPAIGSGRTAEVLHCAAKCAAELPRPVLAGLIGPFSLACRLAGMTEMLMLCLEEPALAHLLLHKTSQFCQQYLQALKQSGSAGAIIAEPAAGLISPEMCREFAADYLHRMITAVRDDAFLLVLHNCGKTDKQIAELLSTGADALHVGNAVDILDILPQMPVDRLLLGNLDPVGSLQNGRPARVYQETMALLQKTAPWPNFILSTGCDVPREVNHENLEAFFQARADYNRQVTSAD
ncbi:MAG: methylcobamide--CoM methyltransferase [Oligosphaeraceae bacterium]|nr:methylcobamide--CoM methyltransferase [Oligosphaeraceae bacterium]